METGVILVVTSKQDSHADAAIKYLNGAGRPVFRLNTEDILSRYEIIWDASSTGWSATIVDCLGRKLNLADVNSAWYRKPSYDYFDEQLITEPQRFAVSEAKALLQCLYSLGGIRWINDPHKARAAAAKFPQLLLAASLGFDIPPTTLTNSISAASNHFEGKERIAIKNLYTPVAFVDNVPRALQTKLLSRARFEKFKEDVKYSPTLIQDYIEKDYELRVTVIDGQAFAVRIESQNDARTMVDWRRYAELCPHYVYDLDRKISNMCIEFVESQGLIFGAIDLIVSNNRTIFLENNPYGQYLWLELETGLPLTAKLCEALMR